MKLFDYQTGGSKWLATQKRALLADEMGLGKSAQAVTAADAIKAQSVLILCPAVARQNWIEEWSSWSSRTWLCSALMKEADAKLIASSDVVVCSYDLATRAAVKRALCSRRWDVCVLDESHFLKELTAGRTNAVYGKGGIVHSCDRVWALSGTPAPNDPSELWPMLYTLFPETITGNGVLRATLAKYMSMFDAGPMDYATFCDRFTKQNKRTIRAPNGALREVVTITDGKNIEDLRRRLAPVMLRRKKEDVMKELPPISFHDTYVEASEVPNAKLELHFDSYFQWTPDRRWRVFHEHMADQTRTLDTLTKDVGLGKEGIKVLEGLQDHVKSLRRWVGLQKVPKLLELVRGELEANAYEKIVIFGVHASVLSELRDGLKDYGAVLLYGGTPADKRHMFIKRFQNDPKCRVFVGNVQAAGTAITLTAAHQVLVAEADWVPANNQQAVMRCHRIGQTKPVTVRFAMIKDSLDERIQRVLKQKTRTLTQLFDHVDVFAC